MRNSGPAAAASVSEGAAAAASVSEGAAGAASVSEGAAGGASAGEGAPGGASAGGGAAVAASAGEAAGGAAVAVRDLRVSRGGRPVLHGLSCSLAPGSVTGLLGPSGCGKSTLMRAIVGVQRVESGELTVLGEPAGSRAVRASVGYVTQAPAVYDDLSARENLAYFARLVGAPAGRVDELVDTVRLAEHADRPVRGLSGGERARVSLGTALLARPRLLVLDEPTVGLDPVLREELWSTFHELAAGGATLIVSSHVMDEADRCGELLLMRDGRLLAALTPGELRERTGERDMERAFLRLIERDEGRP